MGTFLQERGNWFNNDQVREPAIDACVEQELPCLLLESTPDGRFVNRRCVQPGVAAPPQRSSEGIASTRGAGAWSASPWT